MKLEDAIIELKRRCDIGVVVGQYVKLRKNGPNLLGLCPFHSEKSPSFNVRADRGYFKCFGCGAAGDVFEFLQKQTGQLFIDVVRDLAKQSGIEIDPKSGREVNPERAQERERLGRELQAAHEQFQRNLLADRGDASAMAYMVKERRFEPDRMAHLGIGYGGNHGFFARRIVIPIRDARSRLVGFGGRAFGPSADHTAKYINSPSSALYDKGRLLYGLYESLPLIKKGKPLVLVEGYFDVLALHDLEIGAVAPCGTSLTDSHIEMLGKYTRHLVLCMDQDAAGRGAQDKALLMLLKAGFQVRSARIDGKDPDDLWRQGKKEALKNAIVKAPDAVEERITSIGSHSFTGMADRIQAIEQLLPFLCASTNGLVNRQYIRFAAQVLKEDESVLNREVNKIASPGVTHIPPARKAIAPTQTAFTEAEKLLLRAVWTHPELIASQKLEWANSLNQELRDFLAFIGSGVPIRQVPVARDSVIVKLLIEFERMEGLITEDEAREIISDFSLQAELSVRRARLGQNQADMYAAQQQGDLEGVKRALVAQTAVLRQL